MKESHQLVIEAATPGDVAPLVALHAAVAASLTAAHGRGHWSRCPSDRSIERALNGSHVFVGRRRDRVEGTLSLTKKKPWAIDPDFFTPAARPLYLLDMAVHPDVQRRGIGRTLMTFALAFAAQSGFDAVRLDAYDYPAGAGGFYAKCDMAFRGHRTYRSTPLVYFEALTRSHSQSSAVTA